MELERIVHPKRPFRSDRGLFLILMMLLTTAALILAHMNSVVQGNTAIVQLVLFLVFAGLSYIILNRQLLSYRYVLKKELFLVYKRIGRKETLVEQVPLADAVYFCPYTAAHGEHGRENALCVSKKQESYILAYRLRGRLQWLLISPDVALIDGLRQNIRILQADQAMRKSNTDA